MQRNNQNYSRLVGTSPARLILTGLLAVTVVVVMATGAAVWYSSNVRRYEHTPKPLVQEIGWEEDELSVQDPWEIKGLKPIQVGGNPWVAQNDSSTKNSYLDLPCTVYKWPVTTRDGVTMETELMTKGKDGTLHCRSKWPSVLTPESSFTWQINGVPIIAAQNLKYTIMDDGGLKINRLTDTDGGIYKCHFKKDKCHLSQILRTVKLNLRGQDHGEQP